MTIGGDTDDSDSDRRVRRSSARTAGDGEMDFADIADYEQARRLLDQLNYSIVSIKSQLKRDDGFGKPPDWRVRAMSALRRKEILRPKMQKHVYELKEGAANAAHLVAEVASQPRTTDKRAAFVKAAADVLPRPEFNAIMRRAKEMFPAAFADEAPK